MRNRYQSDEDYREQHKANVRASKARRRQEAREFLDKIRASGCSFCDEDELCTLDFHHLDPAVKDRPIANMIGQLSLTRIKAEVEKCIVVCSNCHRKIHFGIIRV